MSASGICRLVCTINRGEGDINPCLVAAAVFGFILHCVGGKLCLEWAHSLIVDAPYSLSLNTGERTWHPLNIYRIEFVHCSIIAGANRPLEYCQTLTLILPDGPELYSATVAPLQDREN